MVPVSWEPFRRGTALRRGQIGMWLADMAALFSCHIGGGCGGGGDRRGFNGS